MLSTIKAEPPPTRDVNRDSGTDSANGGWLRRLVRPIINNHLMSCFKTHKHGCHYNHQNQNDQGNAKYDTRRQNHRKDSRYSWQLLVPGTSVKNGKSHQCRNYRINQNASPPDFQPTHHGIGNHINDRQTNQAGKTSHANRRLALSCLLVVINGAHIGLT
jgi:hypothetical protein